LENQAINHLDYQYSRYSIVSTQSYRVDRIVPGDLMKAVNAADFGRAPGLAYVWNPARDKYSVKPVWVTIIELKGVKPKVPK
jgi:hypothetical protein